MGIRAKGSSLVTIHLVEHLVAAEAALKNPFLFPRILEYTNAVCT